MSHGFGMEQERRVRCLFSLRKSACNWRYRQGFGGDQNAATRPGWLAVGQLAVLDVTVNGGQR
jgi:hypothetical protein